MLYLIYDKDQEKVIGVYASRRAARFAKKFLRELGENVKIVR